ncbi:Ig-like domain-containing protein, partial [Rosenbergiella epipactidis]
TKVNELTFKGTSAAGAQITLKDGDKVLGTTTANAQGNWSFTPNVALSDGPHDVTATASNSAGSSLPSAGYDFTVDTQAPAKPTIDEVIETGHPDHAIADHATTTTSEVTFKGHAEANTTVVLKNSDGKEVGRGTADANGNWSVDTTLQNGTYDITATSSDAAGNTSPVSEGFDVTVDTSANVDPDAGKPAAPTITDVVDKAHTDVAVNDHGTTNVNEMTFSGKAQAGAEITLKDGDKTV